MTPPVDPAAEARARAYLEAARAIAHEPSPDVPPGAAPQSAAVVGGGTMGTGIALALAAAGLTVRLVEPDSAQLARALTAIETSYAANVAKGRLDSDEAARRRARICSAVSIDACSEVDLAIEAVVEDLAVKRDVFAQLDRLVRPGITLASNTSTLDIDAIATATRRPAGVIGLHFFSPAPVMPLLEIVPGVATAPATIAAAFALSARLRKTGVLAGNRDGFIGNRMLYAYRREAEFLLEEGATPADVDRVMVAFGFAMGPFAVADLAGLDIGWRVRLRRHAVNPPAGRYCRIADRLCELGRFGQKTGAGYYRYGPGSRTPLPDPVVTELIARTARDAGITRRPIGDAEIAERCLLALVNEGAAVLAEGTARCASDIDLVWTLGYGFPAARGGPFYWARTIGLATVAQRLEALAGMHGAHLRPHPQLAEIAGTADPASTLTPRPRS